MLCRICKTEIVVISISPRENLLRGKLYCLACQINFPYLESEELLLKKISKTSPIIHLERKMNDD